MCCLSLYAIMNVYRYQPEGEKLRMIILLTPFLQSSYHQKIWPGPYWFPSLLVHSLTDQESVTFWIVTQCIHTYANSITSKITARNLVDSCEYLP